MKLGLKAFGTIVARRVLILFLACAALPVLAFAALGYSQIRGQLADQARERVTATGKSLGMSLVERLLLLREELARRAVTGPDGAGSRAAMGSAARGFLSIGTTSLDGEGPVDAGVARALTRAQRRMLAAGGSPLVVAPGPAGPDLYLVRRAAATRLVWGRIDPAYLEAVALGLPPEASWCVLVDGEPVLGCDSGAAEVRAAAAADGPEAAPAAIVWEASDGPRIAARRALFLGAEFATSAWIVMISEPQGQVLAPVADFTRTLAAALLLCLLVVTWASHSQLHRTLDPLAQLKRGTERVAEGDLSSRVDLETGDEFEELSESFNEMVRELGRQFEALRTTQEIDTSILATHETHAILATALREAPSVVGASAMKVFLVEGEEAVEYGLREDGVLVRGDTTRPRAELEGRLRRSERGTSGERLIAPLYEEGELRGAIEFSHPGEAFATEDRDHAFRIANHVAVALSNARLFRELDELNVGTLQALAGAIDAKSRWTAGHSQRVTEYALAIGRSLDLGADELEILKRGSLLHDVGKIGVPAEVLDKDGRLSEAEWEVMRAHTTHGVRIISPIPQYRPLLPIIGQHHERWDGSGYPEGLVGKAIDPFARVVAVADTFDAMTSQRPYRGGFDPDHALGIIRRERGRGFDPVVVDAFLEKARIPRRAAREASGDAAAPVVA